MFGRKKDITSNKHGGNAMSVEANESIDDKKRAMMGQIVAFIDRKGNFGVTTDEVAYGLDMLHQTASARMTELKATNRIVANGAKRPTRSGRNAQVFVLVG